MLSQDVFVRWLARPLVFLLCLTPFALLVADTIAEDLGANPVEYVTHATGEWALRLLLVTLAVTPLRRLTGLTALLRFRRMLGLFAFFYASLHFVIYMVLDRELAFETIVEDVLDRPYITVGFTAFVMLLPLAATSTRGMMRRLGRNWQRLHRLVYVIATLGVLHFLWLVKADTREPLIYAAILIALLATRVQWRGRNEGVAVAPGK